MKQPSFCRPEAYFLMAEQLPKLETTEGLLQAAIALSMHALDDVQPARVEQRLSGFAKRVTSQVRSDQLQARMAHLHRVLFEEERFRGNTSNYFSPLNSYISVVLETRLGIPISLALIYKCVAEQAGLRVVGINAPGHFLVRVEGHDETVIVDPFVAGQVLTRDEAVRRVQQVTGASDLDEHCLQLATHRQWIARMLANLQAIFSAQHHEADLAAMDELQELLSEH